MKRLLIVLIAIPLPGCVTSQERTSPMALAQDNATKSQCVRYGFPPNTPAFGDCSAGSEKLQ
jgi:hypothetical protein